MRLISAQVGPFKSISKPQLVKVEQGVTVLVGMNEAGKTVFLQSLLKSDDALSAATFDPVDDYPRKDLPAYLKKHKTAPERATRLTYRLDPTDAAELSKVLTVPIPDDLEFSVSCDYGNTQRIGLQVDEGPLLKALAKDGSLSSDARTALKNAKLIREIPDAWSGVSLTEADQAYLASVQARVKATPTGWEVIANEAWKWISGRRPHFAYFGEYEFLPSKMNLTELAKAAANPAALNARQRGILALLRMADIAVDDFTKPGGYEPLKAKLEGVSISLTDQIMEFWKQNENLEVEIDIKPDPDDVPPFNTGPNLYLRIKNRRHRGVSTPFLQRSRGFVWFFSFLVWFNDIQHQLEKDAKDGAEDRPLILLLDEPGLSLHALAQADFLRYIDDLGTRHQVLYTTHSPFMVHSDRLHEVRVVEDRVDEGTVISDNIAGSDRRTVFPLQAALGWTIAQNLFISERNLLVEGPSDLVYLKTVSSILESAGKTFLREDVTIVPTGGLDKVATFVALLGANGLKLAILHDYNGAPDQKLMDLVRQKMLGPGAVLNAAQFRDAAGGAGAPRPSDTEDLFPVDLYLEHFNKAFTKQLTGGPLDEASLPPGDRILDRIERRLTALGVQLRPSGGFNHYSVASHFARNPPKKLDADTTKRFERLFDTINKVF